MNRRGFLGAILAAGLAPAYVKASSLMPVVSRIWTPDAADVTWAPASFTNIFELPIARSGDVLVFDDIPGHPNLFWMGTASAFEARRRHLPQ